MKVHVQPTVVLLSMRVDETVADYFDPHGSTQVQATGDGESLEAKISSGL